MSCDVPIISSSDRRSENSGNIVTGQHRARRGTVSHLSTDTMLMLPGLLKKEHSQNFAYNHVSFKKYDHFFRDYSMGIKSGLLGGCFIN